ncbi:hypothetical protein OG401_02655 [Kitasatospora purpeofusca]|nr:hypothetical protein [Kitasatospora purpeofusca]MCX4683221.1 hypothetical protein [Kitasatospora purpeofusca]
MITTPRPEHPGRAATVPSEEAALFDVDGTLLDTTYRRTLA